VALARTNVTIPAELLAQVDELAGPRGRSAFVADAIEARVKRERLRQALDRVKGIYIGTSFEMDGEAAYRWVRNLREDSADAETP
jgi:metal-responsive CopG/Arc/MetJ family transcriptional regulator